MAPLRSLLIPLAVLLGIAYPSSASQKLSPTSSATSSSAATSSLGIPNNDTRIPPSAAVAFVPKADLRGGDLLKTKRPPPPIKPDPLVHADYIADTQLPTDVGNFRMRAYRAREDSSTPSIAARYSNINAMEPIVIYAADKPPFGRDGNLIEHVPVRIHDQCLTSEVFRSRRCDCKEQLKLSMEYVQQHGGAVIYLQQEGRGIGLANKVAAYQLQDQGMDTVDANLHLGFPDDARQYGVLPSILKDLGIGSIKLMTNNPRKVDRLTALGIKISDTIPILAHPNTHNRKYLETKADRMSHTNFGHILSNDDLPAHGISNGAAAAAAAAVTTTPNKKTLNRSVTSHRSSFSNNISQQ